MIGRDASEGIRMSTALVVIDVQQGMFRDPLKPYRGEEMLARIRQARRETALNARSGESEGTPVPDTWHPSRGA